MYNINSFLFLNYFSFKQKDSVLIEQLKLDKDLLTQKIQSLENLHEEQLRNIRKENYILQAKVIGISCCFF